MGNLRFTVSRALPALTQAATFFSVAALVIGARLWLINGFGSSLAIHDQWGAEGYFLLKPWFEDRLDLASLFVAHNEHRIFFSRILTLALTQLNGQWDSLPEMVFNAALAGLIAVGLLWILLRQLGNQYRPIAAVTVALWLALPYAQENTLWGFQSSFYFLLLFSVLAIWGLTDHRPWTFRWWMGAAGAVFACFSLGSGFLASAVVPGFVGARLIRNPKSIWKHAPALGLTSLIVLGGLYYRVSPPGHQIFKASSLEAWFIFLARCFAFPFPDQPFMAVVIYLPLAALAFFWVTRNSGSPERNFPMGAELVLALGFWVVLQIAALAYSRAGDGHGPIMSRYMDVLALGAALNALSLSILLKVSAVTGARRMVLWISAFVWAAVVLTGAVNLSSSEVVSQQGRQTYLRAGERALRAYLVTGDRSFLEGDPHPVPYVDMAQFQTFIDDPTIRSLLPATARLPLHLENTDAHDQTFVQPGCPPTASYLTYDRTWGSYSSAGAEARGQMRSQTIQPRLPYLEFEIGGGLGQDMSLTVQSGGSTDTIHWLPPSFYDRGSGWRRGYSAVAPQEEARVLARDNSPAKWFAFRDPAELGRLSLLSQKTIARGKSIFILGLIVALTLLVHNGAQRLLAYRRRALPSQSNP